MNRRTAISAINKAGALLVFPLDNRAEPASLWAAFFRDPMRWEWDQDGDNRVANLWHLRSELSTTKQVIYTKWYRGRATYFSLPLFTAMLRALHPHGEERERLSPTARQILEVLEGESPLSTKDLKRITGLKGRTQERTYEKALSELWSGLWIVAFGEVDDGAFPSLAVGATRVLFEDLWQEAFSLDPTEADRRVRKSLPDENLFSKQYSKLQRAAAKEPILTPGKKAAKVVRASSHREGPRDLRVVRFEDL